MRPHRAAKQFKFIRRYEAKKNFFRTAALQSFMQIDADAPISLANYASFFPRLANIGRNKNLCFLTNKPRSVFSKFKIARIALRELAVFGKLIGFKRANW